MTPTIPTSAWQLVSAQHYPGKFCVYYIAKRHAQTNNQLSEYLYDVGNVANTVTESASTALAVLFLY